MSRNIVLTGGVVSLVLVWIAALLAMTDGSQIWGIILILLHFGVLILILPKLYITMRELSSHPVWHLILLSAISIANTVGLILASTNLGDLRYILYLAAVIELLPIAMIIYERRTITEATD